MSSERGNTEASKTSELCGGIVEIDSRSARKESGLLRVCIYRAEIKVTVLADLYLPNLLGIAEALGRQ